MAVFIAVFVVVLGAITHLAGGLTIFEAIPLTLLWIVTMLLS